MNSKKYGLVFEEHQETIDTVLAEHTPVLTEKAGLLIDNGGEIHFLLKSNIWLWAEKTSPETLKRMHSENLRRTK